MSSPSAIVVTSRETLVFRDGRPFGTAANLTGGRLLWPMPSTLAGMIRSRIGLALSTQDRGFFDRQNPARGANIARLRQIAVSNILPVRRHFEAATWEFLFPSPADAIVCDHNQHSVSIGRFGCAPLRASEGCSDLWPDWLLPQTEETRKPASARPAFWHASHFFAWLREDVFQPLARHELGIAGATPETRVHTALDPDTFAVKEGALFESPGIRLATKASSGAAAEELGLAVFLGALGAAEDPTGSAHLGGERRVAHNDAFTQPFPAAPDDLQRAWQGQRFLRLVLTSPGAFDGWAPRWLLPPAADRSAAISWQTIPNTTLEVRLRSAFVSGWSPLSGWDYDTFSPKPMRKIVPAGSVYVIELRDPAQSATVAAALWGKSICDPPRDDREHPPARDGFGTVLIGCAVEAVRQHPLILRPCSLNSTS